MVPTLYLTSQSTADNLLGAFVENGGQCSCRTSPGIVDEHDTVHPGGFPGALRDVLGVWIDEFAPLETGTVVQLDDGSTADLWTELLTATDAEVLASYLDGPLPGTPALTRRAVRSSDT